MSILKRTFSQQILQSFTFLLICLFSQLNNPILMAETTLATGSLDVPSSSVGGSEKEMLDVLFKSIGYGSGGVNLFTGDPSISLGMDMLSLNYSGNVYENLASPNSRVQSSWIGLGWTVTMGYIVASNNSTVQLTDDSYFFVSEDGFSSEIKKINGNYYLSEYKYWKITPNISNEKIKYWEIIREDGTKFIYGDSTGWSNKGNRNSLAWDNWIGNGSSGTPQQVAYQWDLTQIKDTFGNHTDIYYQQVMEGLKNTSYTYTKASYLDRIVDRTEKFIEFHLNERESFEYDDPYTYDGEPDAFQEKYETKHLDYIEVKGPDSVLIKKYQLNYIAVESGQLNEGRGKRFLTEIKQFDLNNDSLPSYKFEYVDIKEDSVFYNGPLCGRLQKITYPTGGTTEFMHEYGNMDEIKNTNGDSVAYSNLTRHDKYKRGGPTILFSDNHLITVEAFDFTQPSLPSDDVTYYRIRLRSWYWNGSSWEEQGIISGSDTLKGQYTWCSNLSNYIMTLPVLRLVDDKLIAINPASSGYSTNSSVIAWHWTGKKWKYDRILQNVGYLNDGDITNYPPSLEITKDLIVIIDPVTQTPVTDAELIVYRWQDSTFVLEATLSDSVYFNPFYFKQTPELQLVNNHIVVREYDDTRHLLKAWYYENNAAKWEAQGTNSILNNTLTFISHGGVPVFRLTKDKIVIIANTGGKSKMYQWNWNGTSWGDTIRVTDENGNGIEYKLIDDSYGGDHSIPSLQIIDDKVYVLGIDGDSFPQGQWYDAKLRVWHWSDNTSDTCIVLSDTLNMLQSGAIYKSRMSTSGSKIVVFEPNSDDEANLYGWHWTGSVWKSDGKINDSSFNWDFAQMLWTDPFMAVQSGVVNDLLVTLGLRNDSVYGDLRVWHWTGSEWDKTLDKEYNFGSWPVVQVQNDRFIIAESDFDYSVIHSWIDYNYTFAGADTQTIKDSHITSKKIADGMGHTSTATFEYEEGQYDTDLKSAKYNRVTVNLPDSNGTEVSYFYNDLESDSTADPTKFVNVNDFEELDGIAYRIELKDSSSQIEQYTVNTYALNNIITDYNIYERRLEEINQTVDGVTSSVEYEYNDSTGWVDLITDINSDSIVRISKTTFACEKYSGMNASNKHMLTQLAQETVYETSVGNSNAKSSTVTVWKEWPTSSGKWAPYKTYSWFEDDPSESLIDFVEWDGSKSGSMWLRADSVIQRDEYGNPIEVENAGGTLITNKWGYSGTKPLANILNASYNKTFVDGFGEGNLNNWIKNDINTDGDTEWLVEDGRLKQISYAAAASGECDRIAYDHGSEITGTVVFEFDCKIANSTSWDLTIAMGGNSWNTGNSGTECAVWSSIIDETWKYYDGTWHIIISDLEVGRTYHFKIVVNSTTNKADYYVDGEKLITNGSFRGYSSGIEKIAFGNYGYSSIDSEWYIDNVRLYPADALCISQSYDPKTLAISSKTYENGNTTYYEYDKFSRLRNISNSNYAALSHYDYYYSRNGNEDDFSLIDPNYVHISSNQIQSLYDNFERNDIDTWTVATSNPNISWSIESGRLRSTTLLSKGYSYINYQELDVSAENIVIDYDVYFDGDASWGGIWYRGIYCDVNPSRYGWRDNSHQYYTTNKIIQDQWHHVRMVITKDTPYDLSTLFINGKQIFSNEPIQNPYFNNYFGFVSNYYDDYVEYDNVCIGLGPVLATMYFDGLGRKIQSQIQVYDEDIVTAIDYDSLGREIRQWKPFATDYNHRFNRVFNQEDSLNSCYYYYSSPGPGPDCEDFPFAETIYAKNPLNRVDSIGAPGANYNRTSGNIIQFTYTNNHDGEFGYDDDELYETRTNDEDGNHTEILTDVFGNKVGQRSYAGSSQWINTAFKYDIMGNLTDIAPPMACTDVSNPDFNSDYCTSYKYNTLNQMTEKATPDVEETVYYLYDQNGNLRFVQDQDGANKTKYFKYDEINRIIEEGTCPDNNFTQNCADDTTKPDNPTPLVKYIYDFPVSDCPVIQDLAQSNLVNKISKVEYKEINADEWGKTYYSYTREGWISWIIQALPDTTISVKSIEYEYDLLGKITKVIFDRSGTNSFYQWNEYDNLGQLHKVFTNTINTEPTLAEAVYEYWPTGQVKTLKLGEETAGNFIETLDYSYTTRDWLKSINAPTSIFNTGNHKFAQHLYYEKQALEAYSIPYFNGNISRIEYFTNNPNGNFLSATTSKIHSYNFYYDEINRLILSDYQYVLSDPPAIPDYEWMNSVSYDLANVSYDVMGNIMTLLRKDESGSGSQFTYNYSSNSNRLLGVTNLHSNDYSNFSYDNNGNLSSNLEKGISSGNIEYDYRNLPVKIEYDNGDIVEHAYNHEGNRVIKRYTPDNAFDPNGSFYIYDALGRTLAVYDLEGKLKFINLYGLDLIGKIF